MREKLNNNPLVQVGLIGVLLVVAAVFFLSSSGGGEEEEESASASVSAAAPEPVVVAAVAAAEGATATAPPPGALAAPPPPADVSAAYDANRTVVLLFVRDGGIDDAMAAQAVDQLSSLPDVSTFVVPAKHIARYASITQGVQLNRVPALVVIRPKRLDHGIPSASVSYGFQSPESVVQAVIDAGYKGPTLDYHP